MDSRMKSDKSEFMKENHIEAGADMIADKRHAEIDTQPKEKSVIGIDDFVDVAVRQIIG